MRNYNGTTRTLEKGDSSYRSVIFKPSKPPLDSELNFLCDLSSALSRDAIAALYPSGFLPANNPYSFGYDSTGEEYGVNFTNTPNTFIVKNSLNQPFKFNLLGDFVDIGGTASSDPSKLVITLPAAPGTGSRQDLVILEMWYMQLEPLISQGKPSDNTIYPFGNVQSGLAPIEDHIYFSAIGTSTTARVQLQYRIRTVQGVNFGSYPEGVDDTLTVFAQGAMAYPTTYTFSKHPKDSGVFVAGDGSSVSRSGLGSVDGHVYAVPLFRVHRRNAAPFLLSNLNGAGRTMSNGSSDRPDGLFSDKIETRDVQDMRNFLVTKANFDEILEDNFTYLLEGSLNTALIQSPLSADLNYNGLGLHIDGMSRVDQTGVLDVAQPNSQRRVISDAGTSQLTAKKINLSDRTVVGNALSWTINDQFVLNVVSSNPEGTVFSGGTKLYALVRDGATESRVEVPLNTVSLGNSTLICSIAAVPDGVISQELILEYEITFPAGYGLSFVPQKVHKVYEVRDNLNYSFVSKNDEDGIKPSSLTTTASAHDYIIGYSENHAFTTLGYVSVTGDGSQSYTIASTHGGAAITHIHWVRLNGVLVTRSSSPNAISEIRKNFDNSFTITFNNAITLGASIVLGVALATNAVRFQELNKAIDEMSTVEILSKTVVAGSNLTKVGFNAGNIIFSAQSEVASLSLFNNVCFIDGVQTECVSQIQGSSIILNLTDPVGVSSNTKVEVVVNRAYALVVGDQEQRLQIFYDYNPYQGITALSSFGTGSNSYVKTKILTRCDGFFVHTSGTDGTNETIPKKFVPIITKLPKAFSDRESDLKNDPLGAKSYPWHKGINLNADFTLNQKIAFNSFDARQGWVSGNEDTSNPIFDNSRRLFDSDSVRFDKTGTNTAVCEIKREDLVNTNFSSVLSSTGSILNNKQLVFWFFIPEATHVLNVSLSLNVQGGTNHIYRVEGVKNGWNRAVFTERSLGNASSSTLDSISLQLNLTETSAVLRGVGFLTPYLEDAGLSDLLSDSDLWYSNSNKTLMRFSSNSGMAPISDGFGIHYLKDRAYAFDISIVAGSNLDPEFGMPHVMGRENFISKENVNNDRGTFKGSNFYSVGADVIAETKKQAVLYFLEQVIEDPTNHFRKGELLLRVETKFCDGSAVEVTNYNFSADNSFDVFRIKGRYLGKI
jgi:hypothetical protein